MSNSLEEIRQIALDLPYDERAELAESLWESLYPHVEAHQAEIDEAWAFEVKRRLDEIDSGSVELISGEQVMAEMLSALSPEGRARMRR